MSENYDANGDLKGQSEREKQTGATPHDKKRKDIVDDVKSAALLTLRAEENTVMSSLNENTASEYFFFEVYFKNVMGE